MPIPRTSAVDFSFAAPRELFRGNAIALWRKYFTLMGQSPAGATPLAVILYTRAYHTEKHNRHFGTAIGVRNVCCARGAGHQAIIPAIDRAHANKGLVLPVSCTEL